MQGRIVRRIGLIVAACMLVSGCAVTPESCRLNQTSTGALVGGAAGAALGGLGAVLGNARGGTGAVIVVGAALVGAAIGAAIGHERDKACHQLAVKQALDQAMAENDAWQARQREYEEQLAQAQSQQSTTPTKTAHKQAAAALPEPPSPPEYMTVAWANSMTGNQGAIKPLNNFTDPASNENCFNIEDTEMSANGEVKTIPARVCHKADGKWS